MTTGFIAGLLLGFSLIVAIGSQNAFVLRQGLRGEHVLPVCLTCALSDSILITVGVAGLGTVVALVPWLEPALRYGGAAFLIAYGLLSFRRATRNDGTLVPADGMGEGLVKTVAVCLALTWLNPHVYLDTVVLLGSISTQYPGRQAAFGLGAVTASFVFFFTLGFGARHLRPLFARPAAWRLLDVGIGVIMWSIAAGLLLG